MTRMLPPTFVSFSPRGFGPNGPAVICTLQASSLRRREVILSRIAIYIAFVFLFCHSVRVVPNAYELYTTYTKVTATPVLQEKLHKSLIRPRGCALPDYSDGQIYAVGGHTYRVRP